TAASSRRPVCHAPRGRFRRAESPRRSAFRLYQPDGPELPDRHPGSGVVPGPASRGTAPRAAASAARRPGLRGWKRRRGLLTSNTCEQSTGSMFYSQLCHTWPPLTSILRCPRNLLKKPRAHPNLLAFRPPPRYKDSCPLGGCAAGVADLGGGGHPVAQSSVDPPRQLPFISATLPVLSSFRRSPPFAVMLFWNRRNQV